MTSAAPLSLVVLAAGIGSRYGGLKQLDPVGGSGETILEFSVYDALLAGFDQVVFVINREIEPLFRQRVGRQIERYCATAYVYQELDRLPPGVSLSPQRSKPWGTAHATLMAQEKVRAPFAVINADDFYGRTAYQLVAEQLKKTAPGDDQAHFCLVGYRLDHTLSQHGYVSRGVCQVDDQGFLTHIVERQQIEQIGAEVAYTEDGGQSWVVLPRQTPVSMNLWGFTPAVFETFQTGFSTFLDEFADDESQPEYFLPVVANQLIEQGKAKFKLLPSPDNWFGVTYQPDRDWVAREISQLIAQAIYPAKLWSEFPRGKHG